MSTGFRQVKTGVSAGLLCGWQWHLALRNGSVISEKLSSYTLLKINRILGIRKDLRSAGILDSVEWYFVTDVSRQSIGRIFKSQAD